MVPIKDVYDMTRPNLSDRVEEDAEDLRRVAAGFVERSRMFHCDLKAEETSERPWVLERKVEMFLSYETSPIFRMKVKACDHP